MSRRSDTAGRLPGAAIAALCFLVLAGCTVLWGCGSGSNGPVGTSSTTAAPTTAGAGVTDATTLPDASGTTLQPGGGTPSPETTVFTGTTGPEGSLRSLTFVGPVSAETWEALRKIVIDAGDDGQSVLDEVAKLATGSPVEIGVYELDSVSGIGFTAGASTSQPIAVAVDSAGIQVMVFAYTVTGDAGVTTIVGFARDTHHVELVVGPLPIDDSTQNITTIPSP